MASPGADPSVFDPRLGARLRQLRKRCKLTQQSAAELVGVSFNFIGAVERAQENPSLNLLYRIADAYQVQPRDLFDFDDEPGDGATAATLKREAQRLIKQADHSTLLQMVRVLRALLR